MSEHQLKIFSGTSNPELAAAICSYLGTTLAPAEVGRFNDGEIKVQIQTNVRGCDVFVIQPTCPPVNDSLMELLIMLDALKRASPKRITAVIPYFGYGRQDRRMLSRQPISARLASDLVQKAGPDSVLTLDLHAGQIQGFFDIPVDNLKSDPVLVLYLREKREMLKSLVIVAPDAGSSKRARMLAERLNAKMALIDKRKDADDKDVFDIVGDLADNAVIVKDMIDTADSICSATSLLLENGVKCVLACATHGILSGDAVDKIDASPLQEVILTDSIPILRRESVRKSNKITVLSVAPLIGEALRRIHNEESVSSLYRYE